MKDARTHGFSLTEVLVALVLISSTSVVLLKQQWMLVEVLQSVCVL